MNNLRNWIYAALIGAILWGLMVHGSHRDKLGD